MPRIPARAKGFSLIVVLLILGLVSLLSITGLRMAAMEERMTGNQRLLAKSQFAAEHGVSQAIRDMMTGSPPTINDRAAGERTDVNWSETGSVTSGDWNVTYTVSHRLQGGRSCWTRKETPSIAFSPRQRADQRYAASKLS